MKKIYFIIIFSVFLSSGFVAQAAFEMREDGVYFSGHKMDVDRQTFAQLDVFWSKDKNHVYYMWNVTTVNDPDSFQVINYETGKDKDHVYWNSQFIGGCYVVAGADPNTYVLYGNSSAYARDKNHVFYITSKTINNPVIGGADPNTFSILPGWGYSKDKNSVYFETKRVEGADQKSFKVIDGQATDYGLDDRYVYCDGIKLENSDATTFTTIDAYKAKDKNNVYAGCQTAATNAGSFEKLNRNFYRDNSHVYFDITPLTDADPAAFRILDDIIGADNTHVYFMSDAIYGADAKTFRYLSGGYSKDVKHVFYHEKMIANADPASFRVTKDNYGSDANADYFMDAVINGTARIRTVVNRNIYVRLKGRIILQVENNGEAWYIDPLSARMFYLARPESAFQVMREHGLGITSADLATIPVAGDNKPSSALARRLSGRIVLQVEDRGQAWYINPLTGKRHFLGRPADAYQIMKGLGLGISNVDFTSL